MRQQPRLLPGKLPKKRPHRTRRQPKRPRRQRLPQYLHLHRNTWHHRRLPRLQDATLTIQGASLLRRTSTALGAVAMGQPTCEVQYKSRAATSMAWTGTAMA
ncbi:hypothetical protein G205_11835 [Arthrobacter nitrophenolicus]|uniref:Uncharacterized protein n=1 Tax=Arthrobacter nitrophenolicus TaxID=683150 RepID=L8TMA6_9MICC|nr:hypothetical protein G205_11835 [Arthrobacter nitrophenolicus]